MKILGVTKLSSRGQIVIPEIIRKALGLKPGDLFCVAHNRKGDLVLKRLTKKNVSELAGSFVKS